MAELRLAKSEAHFLIALGDIGGLFGGRETTSRVSRLAMAGNQGRHTLSAQRCHKVWQTDRQGCGGSRKSVRMDYSRDGQAWCTRTQLLVRHDLIVLFDPAAGTLTEPETGIEVFSG